MLVTNLSNFLIAHMRGEYWITKSTFDADLIIIFQKH